MAASFLNPSSKAAPAPAVKKMEPKNQTAENAEAAARYPHAEITGAVIDAAMTVHKSLGPGLLESVYEKCLAYELSERGYRVSTQAQVPLIYRGLQFESGFRADLVVDDKVLVELKSVESVTPVHEAQTLTYLKLTRLEVGLLINFNVRLLKHGIKRLVLQSS
jgi:GxxExxY protein